MRPQVIVTSYRRLNYLNQTLESMRQDDVEIIVIDGSAGDGGEMERFLQSAYADGLLDEFYQFSEPNPGADVLKNHGVGCIDQPTFIISSDDLIYPPGWATLLMDNYRKINSGPDKYTMCACSTEELIAEWGKRPEHADGNAYRTINGVKFMGVGFSMVAGAVMDTDAVRRVGCFPVYGKTGCGDVAISKRLGKLGYHVGYFREPVCRHIGREKVADYPEYSAAFRIDEDEYFQKAARDEWRP